MTARDFTARLRRRERVIGYWSVLDSPVSTEWLAHARDWVAAQRALDQLETAAMVLPAPQPVAPAPQSQAAPAPAPSGTAPSAPASPDVQASPVALLN